MSKTDRMAANEWKWRRAEAIIRDDYTCQKCGERGGPEGDAELHAHHETPVVDGGGDDLSNLTTLCKACHRQQHSTEAEGSGCNGALRNPNRDEDSGQYTAKYPRSSFLDAVEDADMAGTQDIADAVGCSYETAYKKLRELEDEGAVDSRKVANSRVWLVE